MQFDSRYRTIEVEKTKMSVHGGWCEMHVATFLFRQHGTIDDWAYRTNIKKTFFFFFTLF